MQRYSQSVNSPSGGPSALLRAMALADDRHPPSPVTPNLNLRSESHSTVAQSSSSNLASRNVNPNCDRHMPTPAQERNVAMATPYLKGGQSAPAKLHSRPQNAPQMDSEASSTTSAGNCSAKSSGLGHPLACSSSSKGCGQKHGSCHQQHPGKPVKPVNPESSGRDVARQGSGTNGSGCQKPSEAAGKGESNETGSKTAQFGSEEARKLRQEQQRLQKEEWQRKYGLGAKRLSEGSVPASEHGGAGGGSVVVVAKEACSADDGFQVDELITDGTFIYFGVTLLSQHGRKLASCQELYN